jgi:hypothetical protein
MFDDDEVLEPIPLEHVFCTDFRKVERIGACIRLTFTAPESYTSQLGRSGYLRPAATIIVPAENMRAIAKRLVAVADALEIKEMFEAAREADAIESPPPRGTKPR